MVTSIQTLPILEKRLHFICIFTVLDHHKFYCIHYWARTMTSKKKKMGKLETTHLHINVMVTDNYIIKDLRDGERSVISISIFLDYFL